MDRDPRPLTDEPLPLDLVNTVWMTGAGRQDLLGDDAGLELWLASHGFEGDRHARAPLVAAREAMRGVLADPADAGAREQLNAVLARGSERVRLGGDGTEREVDVAPTWRIAWQAARELVSLLEDHPGRIRKCANDECVLWFLDVSRPGTRRWCSMATCGNREKSRRHYVATAANR